MVISYLWAVLIFMCVICSSFFVHLATQPNVPEYSVVLNCHFLTCAIRFGSRPHSIILTLPGQITTNHFESNVARIIHSVTIVGASEGHVTF